MGRAARELGYFRFVDTVDRDPGGSRTLFELEHRSVVSSAPDEHAVHLATARVDGSANGDQALEHRLLHGLIVLGFVVDTRRVATAALTLAGSVLAPGDTEYEAARLVWNGLIDKRPALIARCTSADDVRAAILYGRDQGLPIAVRGGGHGVAGYATCDDGLVIDLSAMNAVEVDAGSRLVRAGGGARLGDVDAAGQAHGLAVPLGVVSETGIAGLTLSGGIGWLRRSRGLSCDNLVAAELVTADGRIVRVTESDEPDLMWGLRGGGGNFGVVTTFEYGAFPVGPEVMVVFVLYPLEHACAALRALEDLTDAGHEDFAPLAFLGRVPEAEVFDAADHGRPYVAVFGVHTGDAEKGSRLLQPLRELAEPIADLSAPMPYVDAQKALDEDYPNGLGYYWKSLGLDALTDEVVDRLVAHAEAAPSGHSTIDVWFNGGAMGRVDPQATAFGRRPAFLLGYEANFEELGTRDANVAWVRDSLAELEPYSTGGAYLNFPGFHEEGERLLRASFGDANYERLLELKRRYDPENVFRLNGNIAP